MMHATLSMEWRNLDLSATSWWMQTAQPLSYGIVKTGALVLCLMRHETWEGKGYRNTGCRHPMGRVCVSVCLGGGRV